MPSRRVVFSNLARQDLHAIGVEGDSSWGRIRSRSYLRAIRDAAHRLPDFPEMHPLLENCVAELRKARSGSHLLIYRITPEQIEIIRVLHERMDAAGQLGI